SPVSRPIRPLKPIWHRVPWPMLSLAGGSLLAVGAIALQITSPGLLAGVLFFLAVAPIIARVAGLVAPQPRPAFLPPPAPRLPPPRGDRRAACLPAEDLSARPHHAGEAGPGGAGPAAARRGDAVRGRLRRLRRAPHEGGGPGEVRRPAGGLPRVLPRHAPAQRRRPQEPPQGIAPARRENCSPHPSPLSL